MPDRTLDLTRELRAHDPAASLPPLGSEARETLRRLIVSTVESGSPRTSSPRRRALVLGVAIALALVFTATGFGVYSIFRTGDEVRTDFRGEAAKIELPPGAAWHLPNLDGAGLYGGRAAQMQAVAQATCAWLGYWIDGYRSHDPARMRAGVAGFQRVRAAMPVHPEGASEDLGGYDASSLRSFDTILAQERAGNPHAAEQHVKANC